MYNLEHVYIEDIYTFLASHNNKISVFVDKHASVDFADKKCSSWSTVGSLQSGMADLKHLNGKN